MGYFHASKLLKLAFLSSLTRKYVLWKGFYHNFSTKKASASGDYAPDPTKGLCPLDPRRGRCPLDPRGSFAPLTIYPDAAPGGGVKIFQKMDFYRWCASLHKVCFGCYHACIQMIWVQSQFLAWARHLYLKFSFQVFVYLDYLCFVLFCFLILLCTTS